MKPTVGRFAAPLAAVGLVAVLAILVLKTRSIDFDGHNEIIGTLRQLKQIDLEWNVEVLKSKTGFNSNYDPVVSPLPLIEVLENALDEKTAKIWQTHSPGYDKLRPMVENYKKAMQQKIDLVERFKSQNSILRNSSRFLPIAANDLSQAMQQNLPGSKLADEVRETADAILNAVMTYLFSQDQGPRLRVQDRVAALKGLALRLPPIVVEQSDVFLRHVETVLRQQDLGDKLLTELVGFPTTENIDRLTDTYAQEYKRLLVAQEGSRQLLLGYSVFLLGLLGYLAWRLLKSYRLLNRANGDLTESNRQLKESQMQLVQTEKMSALGQMVAGIAHEINTPLAYVKGTVDLLREQIAGVNDFLSASHSLTKMFRNRPADGNVLKSQFLRVETMAEEAMDSQVLEEMQALLKDGSDGIAQISEIVLNLKNFSRLDRDRVAEYSIEEGLESTLLLARNLLKNKVRVDKRYAGLPRITCSPSQINQVFLNVITNAVQSIPEERQGVLSLRSELEDENTVRVEIQDNGIGIPEDVLPKIFDPFFTTKEVGKGTGMGLSISYKIIQAHGGKILVHTEQGIGTVFSILLPISPRLAASEQDNVALAA
jgi:two-component system, NtrC family, sensor kinase